MIDMDLTIDLSLLIAELLLSVLCLILAVSAIDLETRRKRLYVGTIVLMLLTALLRFLLDSARLYGGAGSDLGAIQFLWEVLTLLIDPVLTLHLLCCCEESPRRSPALYTICAIRAAQFVLGIIGDLTHQPEVSTLAEAARSPLLILNFALAAVLIVAELVIVIRRWKKLTVGQRIIFLVMFVLPHPWCILFLELFLIQEQNRRYLRQKEELAREKTRVAVMQMRPHFIYNTLMSIYYLCQEDAEKAQRVILDFSSYLHNNFTAIAREDTVPFHDELEHTRAYLAVEKARFEDKLYVEFDTPVTVFKLPPLTLQPIVENAVKHGISPDLDPLYLTVATEDTGEGVRLTVEDTGPGFAPSDDDAPHIALDNIRRRLKAMCGGTLEIEPREQGGTKVTVFVPLHHTKNSSRETADGSQENMKGASL